ncbi:hypothetical protein DU000_05495 [Parvibium lacunae]|uniref:Uncharacterized protein n=1 Tax=Parvibium lacunae TaxID=1888893 RepID=A0A368L3Y1_9BURK|nr:hypothetical protein DU000_05495 [Parvibium lacunae]
MVNLDSYSIKLKEFMPSILMRHRLMPQSYWRWCQRGPISVEKQSGCLFFDLFGQGSPAIFRGKGELLFFKRVSGLDLGQKESWASHC